MKTVYQLYKSFLSDYVTADQLWDSKNSTIMATFRRYDTFKTLRTAVQYGIIPYDHCFETFNTLGISHAYDNDANMATFKGSILKLESGNFMFYNGTDNSGNCVYSYIGE